jgi:hypothetical protein
MPKVTGDCTIVLLWEHEIIEAARALKKLTLDERTSDADAVDALKACFMAIYSPELASGKCAVTVVSAKRMEPIPPVAQPEPLK